MDEFTREGLAIDVTKRLTSEEALRGFVWQEDAERRSGPRRVEGTPAGWRSALAYARERLCPDGDKQPQFHAHTRPVGKLKHTQSLSVDGFEAGCHTFASTMLPPAFLGVVIWEFSLKTTRDMCAIASPRFPAAKHRLVAPRRTLLLLVALALTMIPRLPAEESLLPSWNEGDTKASILDFIARTTTPGSADFVPPAERIVVFDNDGTLWPENPLPFQAMFVLDELSRLAPEHPEWEEDPSISAALRGEVAAVLHEGPGAGAMLIEATHAGMTTDEFASSVRRWLATARHPRFDRPYLQLAYQPMLELLDLLRDRGFTPFVVSGGGADFMRVWTEDVYGIPPHQVIGSYGKVRHEVRGDSPVLVKTGGIELIDDREGKPVGMHRFIGRRPVAAFGNSDGDQAMLEWTTIGRSPSFGLLVHHTDADREWAYDAEPTSTGKLVTALEAAPRRGWVVVDMARDWNVVFRPAGAR